MSHGPEFGESRSVVPVGGGIPISRFYVPDLHLRAKFRDFLPTALRKQWLASSAAFHAEVCNCAECRAIINGNADNFQLYGESEVKSIKRKNGVVRIEFPTTEAKKRCLRHYLCRKKAEFEAISNGTRASLVADLDTSYNKFLGAESVEVISHLQRWKRVIQELEGL
ncbi:hypothetical protein [Pseudoxanthomonas yeongjuensis]|uniref:hypothetical protein n=1 Tax=Pseudoxanthomonas yeongjuensis TaxID=377616 RepID=UPI001391BCF8|nr:hypothetical protein [Pseudoxanthomonas yeongjuensis]